MDNDLNGLKIQRTNPQDDPYIRLVGEEKKVYHKRETQADLRIG